jgi:glycerophosphoryl diester phosphodiesterase
LTVVPWTVNESSDMERILAFGVDGMISDRPDLLRGALQALA